MLSCQRKALIKPALVRRLPRSMVRMHLSAKRVLSEYKLNQQALNWLLGELDTRFNLALVGLSA